MSYIWILIEKRNKKHSIQVAKEIVLVQEKVSKYDFKSFTVSSLGDSVFAASSITCGVFIPVKFKLQHEPHLGAVRYREETKMTGKLYSRNSYSETLDDLKLRMKKEGFTPANLREVMSWSKTNDFFFKLDLDQLLYFVVAPEGKLLKAIKHRHSITQYPGVFWDADEKTMVCAHASPCIDVLYLGIKPE